MCENNCGISNKVIGYKVLVGKDTNSISFNVEIAFLITDGWEPFEPLQVFPHNTNLTMVQVMVKYESN